MRGARTSYEMLTYLVEVIKGLVKVGMHPCRGFVSDFDGILQDSLGNNVAVS